MTTWTLENSEAQEARVPQEKGEHASLRPPRHGALPPLTTEYGVREELIKDALEFMNEYEDVFKALAK